MGAAFAHDAHLPGRRAGARRHRGGLLRPAADLAALSETQGERGRRGGLGEGVLEALEHQDVRDQEESQQAFGNQRQHLEDDLLLPEGRGRVEQPDQDGAAKGVEQ